MSTASPVELHVVSDATGETASQVIKAAMVQFTDEQFYFSRFKNVRTRKQIEAICEDAGAAKDLIVYTLVSPKLRAYLRRQARENDIPTVDVLGPLLIGLAHYFDYKPKLIAGLLHNVNDRYFERVDAMEFTIAHDDGRDLTRLDRADIVILGISRTSKTPLSMYLSHQGWRVANIPIICGFEIPKEVFDVDPRKVVCLTIDPEELLTIRRARLSRLGQDKGGDYAQPEKVIEEVEYAAEIFRKNRRWAVFNVTGKALEETASEIIKLMASRGLTPPSSLEGGQRPAPSGVAVPPKTAPVAAAAPAKTAGAQVANGRKR